MIFVVTGLSGAGKGTLVSHLVAEDEQLWLSRSWNTRPRRPGESEDAYHFVDRDVFMAKVAEGGFLEWVEVYGDLKGTPVPDPPPGTDLVLEIDLQGARQIRSLHPDAMIVFVVPPSREEQARRISERGDSEEDAAVRLAAAEAEEAEGRALADHVIVNDDVDRAVGELREIVRSHRPR